MDRLVAVIPLEPWKISLETNDSFEEPKLNFSF
ncbi:hypothetical protein PPOLYM_02533 [Paenibacillus polymyxa]|nr:hypothetical protein PPOLYM_02533 [Paenibacillus polymyxa]